MTHVWFHGGAPSSMYLNGEGVSLGPSDEEAEVLWAHTWTISPGRGGLRDQVSTCGTPHLDAWLAYGRPLSLSCDRRLVSSVGECVS